MAVNFSDGQNYDTKGTKTYLNRKQFDKYVGGGVSLDGAIGQYGQFAPHLSFTFQYSDQKCFTFKLFVKTLLETKAWFIFSQKNWILVRS